jgi:hypothetical protein
LLGALGVFTAYCGADAMVGQSAPGDPFRQAPVLDQREEMQNAVDGPAPLIALWQAIALGHPFAPGRVLGKSDLDWVIETGMAPLLYAVTRETPEILPPGLEPRLRAAERWARLRSAETLEAVAQFADRCTERAVELTLLKGISTCGEYYAVPYQRFLGDVDLLVDPGDVPTASAVLGELGYRIPESVRTLDYDGHHHLPPACHPDTGVCVELHTDLFPPEAGLNREGPFARSRVRREQRPATLDGRAVLRLSPELQLLYTASHWALDFVAAPGARALLDATLLIRAEGERLDWGRVLGWLDDPRIAAHLQLMLGYLEARGLVPKPPGLGAAGERLSVLSPRALRVLAGMIDRYQVRGTMRHVREIRVVASRDRANVVPSAGTLRSRLRTLRMAVAGRNVSGLLPILDSALWNTLLERPRSTRSRALASWGLVFPPGDPERFSPSRLLCRARDA